MRGEDRLDAQPVQQRGELGRRNTGRGETGDGGLEAALLGIARATEVVAPAPDAVNPLGEIDDFEVGGERADQRFGIARGQALQQRMQLVIRSSDRGVPGALDELEERVATLLADDVSDQRAERSDVVSERHILWSKLCQGASVGVKSRAAATPQAARSTDARPSLPIGIASPLCSMSVVRRAALNAYAAAQSPTLRACPATSSTLTMK